jgi:hypothetical protein
MTESRRKFTENAHQNKLKELKDYVLNSKDEKDEFYDPKVHTDWKETVIFFSEDKPEKWCVFRIYMHKENS